MIDNDQEKNKLISSIVSFCVRHPQESIALTNAIKYGLDMALSQERKERANLESVLCFIIGRGKGLKCSDKDFELVSNMLKDINTPGFNGKNILECFKRGVK